MAAAYLRAAVRHFNQSALFLNDLGECTPLRQKILSQSLPFCSQGSLK
jgi:hypothetical protein